MPSSTGAGCSWWSGEPAPPDHLGRTAAPEPGGALPRLGGRTGAAAHARHIGCPGGSLPDGAVGTAEPARALRPAADQLGVVHRRAARLGGDVARRPTAVESRSASRRGRPGRGRSAEGRRAHRAFARSVGELVIVIVHGEGDPSPATEDRDPLTRTDEDVPLEELVAIEPGEAADRGAGEAYAARGRGLGPDPQQHRLADDRAVHDPPAGVQTFAVADDAVLGAVEVEHQDPGGVAAPATGTRPRAAGHRTVGLQHEIDRRPAGCDQERLGRPGDIGGDEGGRSRQVVQILVVSGRLVGRPADVVRSGEVACLGPVPCRPVQLGLPAEPVELADQLQRPVRRFRLVAPLAVLGQQHVPRIARAGPVVDPLTLGHAGDCRSGSVLSRTLWSAPHPSERGNADQRVRMRCR